MTSTFLKSGCFVSKLVILALCGIICLKHSLHPSLKMFKVTRTTHQVMSKYYGDKQKIAIFCVILHCCLGERGLSIHR